jgi:two-component system sensor histidine kinase DegS
MDKELEALKIEAKNIMVEVEILEKELEENKMRLAAVSKNFEKFSQEDIKSAYEKANNVSVQLAVKREKERNLLERRNRLEVRLKDSSITVQKAEKLMSHVGVSLEYLMGDLKNISSQVEGMQEKQIFGLKVMQAHEEERQRIAREIHDGPAQSMANAVLKAEICERLIDIDVQKVREELGKLKSVVKDSLRDVRNIIYNLRPMSLDDLGLIPTLQKYTDSFREESGLFVNFRTQGTICEINSTISLAVFRIIQESISNIKKHAQAKHISIGLQFLEDKSLIIHVSDDGKGFDVEAQKAKVKEASSGFGMTSMKERVDILNGSFQIESVIGKGTKITISIPLKEEVGNSK